MPSSGGLEVNTAVYSSTATDEFQGSTVYQAGSDVSVQYFPGPVGLTDTVKLSNALGGLEVNKSVYSAQTFNAFVGTGYQLGNDPAVQYWSGPVGLQTNIFK